MTAVVVAGAVAVLVAVVSDADVAGTVGGNDNACVV
jgi:hypothetical protein